MSTEEKAIFYVLGGLTAAEREGVARERLYNRPLDSEIGKIERALSGMGSGDCPAGESLWPRILCAVDRERRELAGKTIEPCSAGEWLAHGPGIDFKRLWSPKALLIRCGPGAHESAHPQPEDEDEHIIVVAGDLQIGGRSFGLGDYICVPAGALHASMRTSGGCILFTEYSALADRRGAGLAD